MNRLIDIHLLLASFLTVWSESPIRGSSLCPFNLGMCMTSKNNGMAGRRLTNFKIDVDDPEHRCLQECLMVQNSTGKHLSLCENVKIINNPIYVCIDCQAHWINLLSKDPLNP